MSWKKYLSKRYLRKISRGYCGYYLRSRHNSSLYSNFIGIYNHLWRVISYRMYTDDRYYVISCEVSI